MAIQKCGDEEVSSVGGPQRLGQDVPGSFSVVIRWNHRSLRFRHHLRLWFWIYDMKMLLWFCWWVWATSPVLLIRRVAVGGVAAGCVRAWREDDSEDRSVSSLRWLGLSSAPGCRGSSFEMRLQGRRSFLRTPNVLAGLIWLPTGFYKFAQLFDSCLTFPAPKHTQWNMETLKHFGQLKRHKETILRIWQKLLTWNQQRVKTELWNTSSDGNTDVRGPKQIKKIYSRHANIADWQQRHWWKEQKLTEETPQEASEPNDWNICGL